MAVNIKHAEQMVKPSVAARNLGVHPNTILNWIHAGKIPYVKTPTNQYLLPWSLVVQTLGGTHQLEAASDESQESA